MNSKTRHIHFLLLFVLVWMFNLGGCSTEEVQPPVPPVPPAFTQMPHPVGTDIGDLSAIFTDDLAPKDPRFMTSCDADFKKLKSMTVSTDELTQGVRELVKQDPVSYHWCFYGKMLILENTVKGESFVDERQKVILNTYEFLVPVARSFATEFHDSRYLRWAVSRYRRLSEWVFYRKLELTPEGTLELVQASNPFGLFRNTDQPFTVLEKYHLTKLPGEFSGFGESTETPLPATVWASPTPISSVPAAAAPVTTPPVAAAPTAAPTVATPPIATPQVVTAPIVTPPVVAAPIVTPPVVAAPIVPPPVATAPMTTPPTAAAPASKSAKAVAPEEMPTNPVWNSLMQEQ